MKKNFNKNKVVGYFFAIIKYVSTPKPASYLVQKHQWLFHQSKENNRMLRISNYCITLCWKYSLLQLVKQQLET